MPERFDADGPRGADLPLGERPLIEGRFRSYEDKAQWMLRGRERPEPKHPDALPDAERAVIDPRKFTAYSMAPENPQNRGKWRGWADLGWDVHNPELRGPAAADVIAQLRDKLPGTESRLGAMTDHGQRFEVSVEIIGANGRAGTLRTAWQIDHGETVPRLITNWVMVHKDREEGGTR